MMNQYCWIEAAGSRRVIVISFSTFKRNQQGHRYTCVSSFSISVAAFEFTFFMQGLAS